MPHLALFQGFHSGMVTTLAPGDLLSVLLFQPALPTFWAVLRPPTCPHGRGEVATSPTMGFLLLGAFPLSLCRQMNEGIRIKAGLAPMDPSNRIRAGICFIHGQLFGAIISSSGILWPSCTQGPCCLHKLWGHCLPTGPIWVAPFFSAHKIKRSEL